MNTVAKVLFIKTLFAGLLSEDLNSWRTRDALLRNCNKTPHQTQNAFRLAVRYRISIFCQLPAAPYKVPFLLGRFCCDCALAVSLLLLHLPPSLPSRSISSPCSTPRESRERLRREMRKHRRTVGGCVLALVLVSLLGATHAFETRWNETQAYGTTASSGGGNGVFVGLTLIQSAAAKGAGQLFLPQHQNCSFLYPFCCKELFFYCQSREFFSGSVSGLST
jgi:hypothetical protein